MGITLCLSSFISLEFQNWKQLAWWANALTQKYADECIVGSIAIRETNNILYAVCMLLCVVPSFTALPGALIFAHIRMGAFKMQLKQERILYCACWSGETLQVKDLLRHLFSASWVEEQKLLWFLIHTSLLQMLRQIFVSNNIDSI